MNIKCWKGIKMKNETIHHEDARAQVDRLYSKHHQLIGGFTQKMYDKSRRKEFESDCWARVISLAQKRKLDKLSDECQKRFLLAVFRRVYLEQLNKYKREARAVTLCDLEMQANIRNNNPREIAANRELIKAIVAFVNTMPDPDPKIFFYSTFEGRKSNWIGRKMKMSSGVVRVRLHRIRRKIMERFPDCF